MYNLIDRYWVYYDIYYSMSCFNPYIKDSPAIPHVIASILCCKITRHASTLPICVKIILYRYSS